VEYVVIAQHRGKILFRRKERHTPMAESKHRALTCSLSSLSVLTSPYNDGAESWQSIGALLGSKAELSSFALELSKKMKMRYRYVRENSIKSEGMSVDIAVRLNGADLTLFCHVRLFSHFPSTSSVRSPPMPIDLTMKEGYMVPSSFLQQHPPGGDSSSQPQQQGAGVPRPDSINVRGQSGGSAFSGGGEQRERERGFTLDYNDVAKMFDAA